MMRNSSRNFVTVSVVVAICSRNVAMKNYSSGEATTMASCNLDLLSIISASVVSTLLATPPQSAYIESGEYWQSSHQRSDGPDWCRLEFRFTQPRSADYAAEPQFVCARWPGSLGSASTHLACGGFGLRCSCPSCR